jgi:hypothetical protein
MDPGELQEHLAQAQRHVEEGERCVARQLAIVAELERDGHDTRQAVQLLCKLEAWLGLHTRRRNSLRKKFGP